MSPSSSRLLSALLLVAAPLISACGRAPTTSVDAGPPPRLHRTLCFCVVARAPDAAVADCDCERPEILGRATDYALHEDAGAER